MVLAKVRFMQIRHVYLWALLLCRNKHQIYISGHVISSKLVDFQALNP